MVCAWRLGKQRKARTVTDKRERKPDMLPLRSSWPGKAVRRTASLPLAYARPSTTFSPEESKTRMPGTRLRRGYAGPLAHSAAEALAKAASPGMTPPWLASLLHDLRRRFHRLSRL